MTKQAAFKGQMLVQVTINTVWSGKDATEVEQDVRKWAKTLSPLVNQTSFVNLQIEEVTAIDDDL